MLTAGESWNTLLRIYTRLRYAGAVSPFDRTRPGLKTSLPTPEALAVVGDEPRKQAEEAAVLKQIEAGVLRVAYEETGGPTGSPVLLLHGFPYDVRAYDD